MPKIKLIVDGGAMKPGPAVAQQLGPMGINLGKVISDVNAATAGFKGVKVPVELDVNPKTKKPFFQTDERARSHRLARTGQPSMGSS